MQENCCGMSRHFHCTSWTRRGQQRCGRAGRQAGWLVSSSSSRSHPATPKTASAGTSATLFATSSKLFLVFSGPSTRHNIPYSAAMEQEQAKLQANAERELTRLWRAWRTVKEMCQDRVRTHLQTEGRKTQCPANIDLTGLRIGGRRSQNISR